jgi:hypothetical protein
MAFSSMLGLGFMIFFSQIKELEVKLKEQEHDRSVVELSVSSTKMLSLNLVYELALSLLLLLFVLSDQRAGAQAEGTRTPTICCRTKGDSLNDVLSSILLYYKFCDQFPAFYFKREMIL